jgi:hypothetical protein
MNDAEYNEIQLEALYYEMKELENMYKEMSEAEYHEIMVYCNE